MHVDKMVSVCSANTTNHCGIDMLSIINWISAKRRLKESEKTILMMGGRDVCNEMILAQHEMIGLEHDYYREKTISHAIRFVIFLVVSFVSYLYYLEVSVA